MLSYYSFPCCNPFLQGESEGCVYVSIPAEVNETTTGVLLLTHLLQRHTQDLFLDDISFFFTENTDYRGVVSLLP